jgi:peptide/nickel transport system permease protein
MSPRPSPSLPQRFASGPGWAGAALLVLALAAAAAPMVAPYAPDAIDLAARRLPPHGAHWLGTDDLGRDLFSRLLFGARLSLTIGLVAAALSGGIGIALGAVAGWHRGRLDDWIMRLTDAMLVVPRLPLLMIAAAILAPAPTGLAALIGLAGWMETARVVRSDVRRLAGMPFVESAHAVGIAPWRVLVRHVLPNAVPTMAVAVTLAIARAILLESALSYFGVGVQPPTASWGTMLLQAQSAIAREPWLAIFPGVAIAGTVLCVNALGDRLSAGRRSMES